MILRYRKHILFNGRFKVVVENVACSGYLIYDNKIMVKSKIFNRLCFKPDQVNYGFTLLELLVVMVIIGLLAGYVAPRYFSQIGKSEVKAARAQLDALEKSLEALNLDIGHYPSTEQGLNALVKRPTGEGKWQGPYLKKTLPLDPWGNPYVYLQPGEHGDYDILSYGRDGKPGGEGDNADIVNW